VRKQPSPCCKLQGHRRSVQRCNTNSGPRRVKTAQTLQRSKGGNAVLSTQTRAGGGGLKSFRGVEICNLVTANTEGVAGSL
jgi:hypothetical protein